ncbi:MAG: hypothetical protein Unbinned3818contig1000_33 [Prokaryotic dsDNA virus sp.]|nr:MAG: hypothetical protein Unbinned3818contig1000_33 [Prokaryotic dsDNA virus sp.]|tara:strand:- start:46 stop:435 length:390 start_codon:yes stop_codon:yes gene_type:complete
MPDGKDEVKMSHLHALDRRISDHKLEVSESLANAIGQMVGPMNELTTEMRLSNQNSAYLDKRLDKVVAITESNTADIVNMGKDIVSLETTQGGILGVTGKVFPFLMSGIGLLVAVLMSISVYLKMNPLG